MTRPLLLILLAWLAVAALAPAAFNPHLAPDPDGIYRFGPCHASLKDNELKIGNGRIERTWAIKPDGTLRALSLKDAGSGLEWIGNGSGMTRPNGNGERYTAAPSTRNIPLKAELNAKAGQVHPTEEPSLLIALYLRRGQTGITHQFQIFPGAQGIVMERWVKDSSVSTSPSLNTLDHLNTLEAFTPAPTHWVLNRVKFFDQTDVVDWPLVAERQGLLLSPEEGADAERSPGGLTRFKGNVFFIEDARTSAGVLFLKHAPLPDERPLAIDRKGKRARNLYDLASDGKQLTFSSHEITLQGGATYPVATLVYQGGRAGRIAALQQYHRQLRRYDPARDGLILCNFWGEWNSNKTLETEGEVFVKREIDAAAHLGADVFELDAGWHRGPYPSPMDRKKRDAVGNYGMSPNFWDFHPTRLPHGIKPFVAQAREKGMQFGLWFPPDNFNDQAAWEKDHARILDLHLNEGVNYFKVDLLKVYTRTGEERVQRLIEELLQDSGGRITIDLDVTGGKDPRPGYFGNPHHGPLFVENRWTHYPVSLGRKDVWWPHRTLRNLWCLAQYMDPIRLRMEFMNNLRNAQNYGTDPLAPAQWAPDYVFATVMFSSPLAWMEVSQLPEAYMKQVAPLVQVWKAHREAMFRGSIIPVGAMPDGHAWTGFISASPDRKSGYALIFRELNDTPKWETELPLLQGKGGYEVKFLAGEGKAVVTGDKLKVEIPEARRFAFVELRKK